MRLSAPLLVLSAVVLLTGTVVHGCRQFCKLQDCTADGHSNQLLTVINDATVMYCMQRCGQDESCQSFSYKESGSKCKLYSVDVLAGGACRKYHRKYAIYSTTACKISAVSPVTEGYTTQAGAQPVVATTARAQPVVAPTAGAEPVVATTGGIQPVIATIAGAQPVDVTTSGSEAVVTTTSAQPDTTTTSAYSTTATNAAGAAAGNCSAFDTYDHMVTTDGSNSLAKYDNSGTGYTVADCQAFCLAENTFHCTATIHYSDYGYGHGYCLHFGFSPYVEPSAISYRRYCTDEALSSCYLEEVGQNLGIYYTVQYSLDNSTCATRCFDRERCIGYNTFTGGHNRCRLFEQRKMSRYGATLSIRLRKCG